MKLFQTIGGILRGWTDSVADGLIAEEWICSDMASLFSQLG